MLRTTRLTPAHAWRAAGYLAAGCLALCAAFAAVPAAAAVCVACHGADGVGIVPQYPTLAGQHADYLRREIAQYKTGGRKNAIMAGLAAQVKDADVEEIAAYYSSLTP